MYLPTEEKGHTSKNQMMDRNARSSAEELPNILPKRHIGTVLQMISKALPISRVKWLRNSV